MGTSIKTTVYIDGVAHESSAAAARSGRAFIAGPVETSWSRPSPMTTPDPYDCTFVIRKPSDAWITPPSPGQTVRVVTTIGGTDVVVFIGSIDVVRAAPRDRYGWQDTKIAATCLKGQASRTRFGDTPWPVRWADQNLAVIARLWPGFDYSDIKAICEKHRSLGYVKPNNIAVDIDSRSPVEVAERILAAFKRELRTTSTGLQGVPTTWSQSASSALLVRGGRAIGVSDALDFTYIPARIVEDTGTEHSFDSRVTSATVTYTMSTPDRAYTRETSKTWGNDSGTGVSLRFDTFHQAWTAKNAASQDEFDAMTATPPVDLSGIAGGNSPEPILDPFTFTLTEVDAATARLLVNLDTRWNTLTLVGARGWLPASHRVTGASLRLSGSPDDCRITISTVPASYARPSILTFSGMPDTLAFQDVWDGTGAIVPGKGGVQFEDMATATSVRYM